MNKRYALVTGAASGIGESVAQALVDQGDFVFALDKQPIKIPKITSINCDISDIESIVEAFNIIQSATDTIDYLVNSAGILCHKKRQFIEELEIEEWNRVINVNLTGTLLITKYAIPLLKHSTYPSIVNYSSEQTQRPITKSAPYLISKIGIEYLTKLSALELIDKKIRVNCIRSAAVDTPFLKTLVPDEQVRIKMRDEMNVKMPLGIISPKHITELTLFLLSHASQNITGQVFTVDSGVLL